MGFSVYSALDLLNEYFKPLASRASDGMMLIDYLDVVMEYAYGRSDHRLDDRMWGPDYHDAALESGKQASMLKHMFFIFTIMQSIPKRLVVILSPPIGLILKLHQVKLPTLGA